jgi:hypothetical protein
MRGPLLCLSRRQLLHPCTMARRRVTLPMIGQTCHASHCVGRRWFAGVAAFGACTKQGSCLCSTDALLEALTLLHCALSLHLPASGHRLSHQAAHR